MSLSFVVLLAELHVQARNMLSESEPNVTDDEPLKCSSGETQVTLFDVLPKGRSGAVIRA